MCRSAPATPDVKKGPKLMADTLNWLRTGILVAGIGLTAFAIAHAQQVPFDDIGHPTFMSPHASPIVVSGGYVFVVNTPADTVDVIDTSSNAIVTRVNVGIDPVGLAVRPDGREVWVANHVSDSVSVIDTDPTSPTRFQVIATVQDFDPVTRATRFDEPVGIAFASNDKAYVALSSENRIAVIDVGTRQLVQTLAITAQDPRAISVRGDRLYVIPFESNNKTQISGGLGPLDGNLITFDAQEHVLDNNNVLSLGAVVDIVKHPKVPDRDLYIFDTTTDELVEVVDTLGTLLYGLTVDSRGRVFVAQADARNDANGRAGTLNEGLAEMENRAFLNRITSVDCGGGACAPPAFIDLEPLPPLHPAPGMALATPFAIQISDDDSTLVVSAAGSDTLFTVDATSGAVLGRADVDAVPRGIALESAVDGRPSRAWVLNAVANTVSRVDLSDPASPQVVATVPLDDPTHPAVKRGRIAFNGADASTTGTFACESCHPDGHTDQLVWVLNTPICDRPGCTQIPPRTTMPIRGLRDTAPYHWDGIPGDPFGGPNTANIGSLVPPNCNPEEPESCTLNLADGSLATTMCMVGDCPVNDEGKPGALSAAERDDLAKFLLSVPYPPSQRRSYDNVLSSNAQNGFKLFHIDGDNQDDGPNVCGRCHRMPFLVSTNTPGTGMEAPTWRGAYDRWLILPQGRLNLIDFDFYESITRLGTPEREVWNLTWGRRQRFDPVWDMVLEGSTGFSGSFARQVTLNQVSANAALSGDLLDALELSAREGGIVLQGEGVFISSPPTADPAPTLSPTFSSIQSQIFEPKCVRCHGAVANAGLDLRAATGFANLVNAASTETALLRVAPGDPENSYLIHKLEGRSGIVGSQMPKDGPFLSAEQIDVVRSWITAGAANNNGTIATPVALQFIDGIYVEGDDDPESFTRAELVSLAAAGRFVGTITGRLGINVDVDNPQPALWSLGPIQQQRGLQEFPTLSGFDTTMVISARHVREGANLVVDGRRVLGDVRCQDGRLPNCVDETIVVKPTLPAVPGMHFLQIQNPDGLFSNDYIFFTEVGHPPPIIPGRIGCRPLGRGRGDRRGLIPCSPPFDPGDGQRAGVATGQSAAIETPLPTELLGTRVDVTASDHEIFTTADGTQFQTDTVVTGLEVPTSLAFAPDGRLFVTERPGRVRVVLNGELRPDPALTLGDVFAVGEAGLLGLALDPEFSQNGFVYLLYTRNRPGESPANRIVRYREVGNTLAEPVVLLDDLPAAASYGGGRLRFGPDGLLYAATGDGGEADDAQDLASFTGKILRIRRDGTTPSTNPFASPVYSVGHRNAQALDWHPLTRTLWATEPGSVGHLGQPGRPGRPGRPGNDEVNRIEAGANYGWPVIEGVQTMPGMRPPVLLFSPPIAPSGASFYDGATIAGFRNDLFLAALSGTHLHRVRFDPADPSRIIGTERLLDGRFGRLRDVVTGPDGGLYVATSNRDGRGTPTAADDRIIRLGPVQE